MLPLAPGARLRCKLKSCPAAPGSYTHRVHARLLFVKRWKKDSDGVLEQPVCEAPCPGAGAVWRLPSLGQQVAAVAHSLGGDLIITLSSRQVKRRSWSWSKWITSSTKKKCGVTRVRRQSEMEKVKAFIQRQRKSTFSHLYQLRKLSPAECRHSGEKYGTHWNILSRLQRN